MKVETMTFYICECCNERFSKKDEALAHEDYCLRYYNLKSKIQVQKAQQDDELIITIIQWLKKIASTYNQNDVIDRNRLHKKLEYFAPNLPPNSDIIPLSNLIDELNYAFAKKKADGLMLSNYEVYIAIFDGKIIGVSLEDHSSDFENENYDELIFILTNREAETTIRRVTFDVLLENYSQIVKERKENW